MRNNQRRDATFDKAIWSVHGRTITEEGRTNNNVEAAHRRLQSELQMIHPTLYKLIDGLRGAQAARDTEYARFIGGHSPEKKRKKYIKADEKILRILTNYDQMTKLEVMKGIASVYGMV